MPEKQRPLNLHKHHSRKTAAWTTHGGGKWATRTKKPASWIRVLLDKEHDMHGLIKSQRQMCHKQCYMKIWWGSKWRCGHVLMQHSVFKNDVHFMWFCTLLLTLIPMFSAMEEEVCPLFKAWRKAEVLDGCVVLSETCRHDLCPTWFSYFKLRYGRYKNFSLRLSTAAVS